MKNIKVQSLTCHVLEGVFQESLRNVLQQMKTSSRFLTPEEVCKQYTEKQFKEKFGCERSTVFNGFTNSPFLEQIKSEEELFGQKFSEVFLNVQKLEIKPRLTYRVKQGINPSDLFESNQDDSITIIDCKGALLIIFYQTMLSILKKVFGDDQGRQKFNALFSWGNDDDSNALIICPYFEYGRFMGCQNVPQGINTPSVSLNYFLTFFSEIQTSIFIGDMVYFRNHVDYFKKHPEGFAHGFSTACVAQNQFWSMDLRKSTTWEGFKGALVDAYNEPTGSQGVFVNKISKQDLPNVFEVMARLDIEKLVSFLNNFSDLISIHRVTNRIDRKLRDLRKAFSIVQWLSNRGRKPEIYSNYCKEMLSETQKILGEFFQVLFQLPIGQYSDRKLELLLSIMMLNQAVKNKGTIEKLSEKDEKRYKLIFDPALKGDFDLAFRRAAFLGDLLLLENIYPHVKDINGSGQSGKTAFDVVSDPKAKEFLLSKGVQSGRKEPSIIPNKRQKH